jgi:serine/threonine protein phosphatase PrpC
VVTPVLSAAASHVGKVRASNQDSGYVGNHLFVVADGMGGHAGGDVASAITVRHLQEQDHSYPNVEAARDELYHSILDAGKALTEAVSDHPELTGMGTTVSAMIRVGHQMVIAHIGDSRIYRLRNGVLEQITSDHTFVQRLVDSGRITPEEAAVHPRRSVLMRVLGDVDVDPEVDTHVVEIQPEDRWLVCSDGLSGYVSEREIAEILISVDNTEDACEKLILASLAEGAPDNVTCVVLRALEGVTTSPPREKLLVGSAANPLTYESGPVTRVAKLPTLLLHPLRAQPVFDEHFEPEESYLDELIEEDRRRRIRRQWTWLAGLLVVLGGLSGGAVASYEWTQTKYFVGESDGMVMIYQGVQQNVGPFALSTPFEETGISLDELPLFIRQSVEDTLPADSIDEARAIVDRLSRD